MMKITAVAALSFLLTTSGSSQQFVAVPNEKAPSGSEQKPPIDPTKNVLGLVEEAIRRQDDLRQSGLDLTAAKMKAADDLNLLRYEHARDMAALQSAKLDKESMLRAEFNEKLSVAEAKRIDAIRAVDVGAVQTQNAATAKLATDLATQTQASAEVLRNQVAASADALRVLVSNTAATALQNQQQQFAGVASQIGALSSRLTTLEQAGAEGKGKQIFQDPQISELAQQVRSLVISRSGSDGAGIGRGEVAGWIVGGLGLALSFLGLASAVLFGFRNRRSST